MKENSVVTVDAVSPRQFLDWLKENLHKTWYMGKNGGFGSAKEDATPFYKYFYLSLDTRDMKIFHIGTNMGPVDFRDEPTSDEKNILDLLSEKVKKSNQKDETKLETALKSRFPDVDIDQIYTALEFIKDECVDELFDRENDRNRDFPWEKKLFSYHDMRDKFTELVERLK